MDFTRQYQVTSAHEHLELRNMVNAVTIELLNVCLQLIRKINILKFISKSRRHSPMRFNEKRLKHEYSICNVANALLFEMTSPYIETAFSY